MILTSSELLGDFVDWIFKKVPRSFFSLVCFSVDMLPFSHACLVWAYPPSFYRFRCIFLMCFPGFSSLFEKPHLPPRDAGRSVRGGQSGFSAGPRPALTSSAAVSQSPWPCCLFPGVRTAPLIVTAH